MVSASKNGAPRVVIVTSPHALDQPWIAELGAGGQAGVLAVVGAARVALDLVRVRRPDVLLVDRAPEHAEAMLRESVAVAPATACVAVLPGHRMTDVRRLVSAGARDILVKPLHREQLLAALREAVQHERERPRRVPDEMSAPEMPGLRPGRLVMLIGPKGGVGTTTIAANLAVALRRVAGEEVALVDLSDQFGDLGVLFNVLPRKTLHRQVLSGTALDDAVLQRTLVRHASGVALALAPEDPPAVARLHAEHVSTMLDALRRRFRWSVADCRSRLDEVVLTAAAAADPVLLLTTPDVLALRDARRAIEYLAGRGVRGDRCAVLVNRCVPGKGPGVDEVARFLGWPVRVALLDDSAFAAAAERGVPLAQGRPPTAMARRLLFLAAVVAGDAAAMYQGELGLKG